MDDKPNKVADTVNNICTLLGGALLLYPLIDQAAKTIVPEMQKLTSGEMEKELKQLTDGTHYEKSDDTKEHDEEKKNHLSKIAELERQLAEYKEKSDEHKSET